MANSVTNHEPDLALFVEDENPLLFYEAIGTSARQLLKKGGKLYFEINQYLPSETKDLIQSLGFLNIKLIKDINGNYRILYAEK